ncbi:Subtilisin-like protease 9 [Beauveria bassiana]|nr:Subtilisin-like protease 9 [Beauveria bassiana]
MKLLLSHLAVAVAIVQIGHALPQASKDGDAVGHIVVLKGNLSEAHLNEHLDAVKGIQRRSKRDGSGETGVKHVVDGASYGFQGYTGVFTPETLEYIKAHEHVCCRSGIALGKELTLDKVDYVEEDSIISEPPVESREVSAADLVPVDESADTDTANVAKGSAGGLTRQKSTIGGTLSWGQGYSTLLGKGLRLDVVVSLSVKTKRNNPTVLNETDPATAFNFTAPSADMTGVNLDEYFAEPDPDTIFDDIPDAPETSEQSAKANGKRAVAEIPGCTGRINTHYKFAEDYE